MKITLITGLDGSGKSTLLSKLAAQPLARKPAILFLPHIATESLREAPDLYHAAAFVNALGTEADVQKTPALKGASLCAAMLLFRPLVALHTQMGYTEMVCERHPLFDTGVYAKFYAEKLTPTLISPTVLEMLDQKYASALTYLHSLIPDVAIRPGEGLMASFLEIIYQWFYVAQKTTFEDLGVFFQVELPHKIHYLRAEPAVLIERLRHREHLEAHETASVLAKLGQVYDQLIESLDNRYPGLVHQTQAESPENLDRLFEQLCLAYQ